MSGFLVNSAIAAETVATLPADVGWSTTALIMTSLFCLVVGMIIGATFYCWSIGPAPFMDDARNEETAEYLRWREERLAAERDGEGRS